MIAVQVSGEKQRTKTFEKKTLLNRSDRIVRYSVINKTTLAVNPVYSYYANKNNSTHYFCTNCIHTYIYCDDIAAFK